MRWFLPVSLMGVAAVLGMASYALIERPSFYVRKLDKMYEGHKSPFWLKGLSALWVLWIGVLFILYPRPLSLPARMGLGLVAISGIIALYYLLFNSGARIRVQVMVRRWRHEEYESCPFTGILLGCAGALYLLIAAAILLMGLISFF